MNSQLMTQAEYAAHRGVSPPAVSNWKKAGLLVMGVDPDRPGKFKVDVLRTDANINAKVDPMRGRPSNAAPATTAAAPVDPIEPQLRADTAASIRMDLAREQIIGQRIKNAQAAGDLVPAIELTRRAAELGRVARERVLAAYRAISERLAAERDVRTIMAIGQAEFDRVFSELADQVDGGLLAEADDEAEEAAVENEIEAASAEPV